MLLTNQNLSDYADWYENANFGEAFCLIDKEKDWTSFDVVAKVRGLTRIKKVGHAGTLDPLATGLLILGFNKGTKRLAEFQELAKTYIANIKLGAKTKTDDSEAGEEDIKSTEHLNDDDIKIAVNAFIGKIEQIPPKYSAKKVHGKKLYQLARKNQDVEIKSTFVEICAIEIITIEKPFIRLKIDCSKGTYIRALARDIGERLGVGGYLADLRRTSIGNYNVDSALKISDLADEVNKLKKDTK